MKIWKFNLETYSLVQVIKFDANENCIFFEAQNWKEADKIVNNMISKKIKKVEPPLKIVKIIEEIVFS